MQKNWLIHFSGDDYWHSNPHSRYHITNEFRREYRVLWINPVGARMPSLKKKKFFARILRKLKSFSIPLKKVDVDFYVAILFSFPVFRDGIFQKVNHWLVKSRLKSICRNLDIHDPVLFYTSPVHAATIDMIKYKAAIYYYSDLYTEYREFNARTRDFTKNLDKKLYIGSDLIICASSKIYDELKNKTTRKVVYFPHQVDYSYFSLKPVLPPPSDIAPIKKPIIGYYGTLSDSNDWETIRYCAFQRPEYNFVFIGRKDIPYTGLENSPNVFFLGKKPFEEIRAYGNRFDVALLFWIRRPWIQNCSPLKLKEYLAMGIPVVSTYIEEVARYYNEVVLTSESKEEFLKNIDLALDPRKRGKLISRGIGLVKDDSWAHAVTMVKSELSLEIADA
jgi:glycosyltransferase involved in cell wall biosynthesis